MIMKWAKLLPYWILVWALRREGTKDGNAIIRFDKDYDISYYQLDGGEFVVFVRDIQDAFDERKESKRKKKLDKKLDKLNKQLRGDFRLKTKLKEQFEDEQQYYDSNYE